MDILYPQVAMSAFVTHKLMGLNMDITGEWNIPKKGGAVLACNHLSYLDVVLVGMAAQRINRPVRFMAKRELFDNPVTGTLMRQIGQIPVDRTAGSNAYSAAIDALRSGELIGIFPEATFSVSFEVRKLKTGACRMAMDAGVPVVPMATFGGQRVFQSLKRIDLLPGKTVGLTVGKPIAYGAEDTPEQASADLQQILSDLLHETIDRNPASKRGEGRWWMPASRGGSAPTPEEAAAIEEYYASGAAQRGVKPPSA